jgi:hypothetical protein
LVKQLDRYRREPAYPYEWPSEQSGMQGGTLLEGKDLDEARQLFRDINHQTRLRVFAYFYEHPETAHRLHKSLLNRLLEPMQWHRMLITGSQWTNFLVQRADPNAQPEFRVLAELIKELLEDSQPRELVPGEWHTPYVDNPERDAATGRVIDKPEPLAEEFDLREISSARCARTSYMTQRGIRDYLEDARLYERLVISNHWSPLEHVCTPDPHNLRTAHGIVDPDTGKWIGGITRHANVGKFAGWTQWRHVVEARQGYNSYA